MFSLRVIAEEHGKNILTTETREERPRRCPAAAGAAELEWLRFRSDRGRFAVQLPESPEEVRDTRVTLGGIVHSSEYLARRDATSFRVEHHDLPWLAKFLLSGDALLVLVGGRLYVVVALGPQAERDASTRERFFRSFEVGQP